MAKELTIEFIKNFAVTKDGLLLTQTYINCRQKLQWLCKNKHMFYMSYDHVKRGLWCCFCSGHFKRTIEYAKKIAEDRDGKCLSECYESGVSLRFECKLRTHIC